MLIVAHLVVFFTHEFSLSPEYRAEFGKRIEDAESSSRWNEIFGVEDDSYVRVVVSTIVDICATNRVVRVRQTYTDPTTVTALFVLRLICCVCALVLGVNIRGMVRQ
jgi:hypothetical protein